MAADEERMIRPLLFLCGHRRHLRFILYRSPYFSSALIRSAAVRAASVAGYFLTIPL
jgi:hypothetical protein